MSLCDLMTGAGRIQRATKQLRGRWEDVQNDWNDVASQQFAERHLEPIVPRFQQLLAAISELNEVFHSAESECRDDWE